MYTSKEEGTIQETTSNSVYLEPSPARCWQEGKMAADDDRGQAREGLTSARLKILDFILNPGKEFSRRMKCLLRTLLWSLM